MREGLRDLAAGAYVALFPNGRPGPKLLLQRVEETKSVKNRMHLDIETPDIELEANRLVGLGGTRVSGGPCREHGSTWILMTDPEGNEFCGVACILRCPSAPVTLSLAVWS